MRHRRSLNHDHENFAAYTMHNLHGRKNFRDHVTASSNHAEQSQASAAYCPSGQSNA
jgi:hypothetical protein